VTIAIPMAASSRILRMMRFSGKRYLKTSVGFQYRQTSKAHSCAPEAKNARFEQGTIRRFGVYRSNG
jgi:hypothetical protein